MRRVRLGIGSVVRTLRRRALAGAFALASGACGDSHAGASTPSEPNRADDAGGDSQCPASSLPAVDGCPCVVPPGDYCCDIGHGMTCDDDGTWVAFWDGPCAPALDEDAGGAWAGPAAIDHIECR